MTFMAELGAGEPVVGELLPTVGHVFTAEDAEPQHLLGSEFWFEAGGKLLAGGLGEEILISPLHSITYFDLFGL